MGFFSKKEIFQRLDFLKYNLKFIPSTYCIFKQVKRQSDSFLLKRPDFRKSLEMSRCNLQQDYPNKFQNQNRNPLSHFVRVFTHITLSKMLKKFVLVRSKPDEGPPTTIIDE